MRVGRKTVLDWIFIVKLFVYVRFMEGIACWKVLDIL